MPLVCGPQKKILWGPPKKYFGLGPPQKILWRTGHKKILWGPPKKYFQGLADTLRLHSTRPAGDSERRRLNLRRLGAWPLGDLGAALSVSLRLPVNLRAHRRDTGCQ